jgi:hypothetical protein
MISKFGTVVDWLESLCLLRERNKMESIAKSYLERLYKTTVT